MSAYSASALVLTRVWQTFVDISLTVCSLIAWRAGTGVPTMTIVSTSSSISAWRPSLAGTEIYDVTMS